MLRLWVAIATLIVFNAASGFGAELVSPDDQQANQKLLEEKLSELNRLQKEIDQLRAVSGTAQQILVKVQVLEVARTKLRKLGVDWARVVDVKDANGTNAKQANKSIPLDCGFGVFDRTEEIFGFIDMLQKNNIAKMLAEPSLVIVSGRPATFQVGGEMPLPAAPGSDKAVEFQSFGTKLDVLAVALGNKSIRMELRVRLAEPDYSHSVQIAGAQVPVLNVRELDTALELKAGQSGYLNGMVQKRETAIQTESGIRTEAEEIETWFIVTPELVSAVASAPAVVR
jgi:pilus assembly protein CpaC